MFDTLQNSEQTVYWFLIAGIVLLLIRIEDKFIDYDNDEED